MRFHKTKLLIFPILLILYAFLLFTLLSSPTPTASQIQNLEKAKVIKVIDGDTIEIEGKRKVRYIGIDAPETKDPRRPIQCFGEEAYNKNKELVEGYNIEMEKDVSETDKFGRLLRYVYVNGTFVNEYLVKEGFASVSTFPPDVRYVDIFLKAQTEAREKNLGLWSKCRD